MPDTTYAHDDMTPAEDSGTISRRRLLKALAASGLAAAASSVPAEWLSPEVEVGVLPAHAQVSPVPPYTLVSCYVAPGEQEPGSPINPLTYISCWCDITPADQGVVMRVSVILHDIGDPQSIIILVCIIHY